MSFQKAADLLRLAELATARYQGVSLTEIEEEFRVDRRTAQRMTKALEEMFPHCITRVDDDRRKFWKLRADEARLMLAQGIRDNELAALELAIRRAERDGAVSCGDGDRCPRECNHTCLRLQSQTLPDIHDCPSSNDLEQAA